MPSDSDDWYLLGVTSHFGYPQPEDSYVYTTYHTSDYCDRCGIGGKQRAPFRFRAEPKARRSHFLQLNWVFDELCVRPPVRDILEKAHVSGIAFGRAVLHKTGRPLESIVQLLVPTLLPPGLVVDGLQPVTCKPNNEEPPLPLPMQASLRYPPDYPYCGRVKYHWPSRLRLRRATFRAASDFAKSSEWFGSGGSASQAILCTGRVIGLVRKHRWRGLRATPVELV